MQLGREVDLSPGDIVLDWDPDHLKRGTASPLFGPCLLWPNGWMGQDCMHFHAIINLHGSHALHHFYRATQLCQRGLWSLES